MKNSYKFEYSTNKNSTIIVSQPEETRKNYRMMFNVDKHIWKVESINCPQLIDWGNEIFIRGDQLSRDDEELTFTNHITDEFFKCMKLIQKNMQKK